MNKKHGDLLRIWRVLSKDVVLRLDGCVAREAGLQVRLFVNFAVLELRESPAACRGLLF